MATVKTTEPTTCVPGQRGKEHMLQGVASHSAIGNTSKQASYAHGRRNKEFMVTVRCLAHAIWQSYGAIEMCARTALQ
jgi:hypothetical protein